MSPPRTKKRLTRAQRRQTLLDAAAGLAVDEGLDAVTMEGVAARAGVSKALPYSYYDNAAELLSALFERETGELDRRVVAALEGAETYEDMVRATLDAWFDIVKERGPLLGALLAAPPHAPFDEQRAEHTRRAEEFLGQIIADEFQVPIDEAIVAAGVLQAGSIALLEMWLRRRRSRKDLTDLFVRIAVGVPRSLAGPSG